MKETIEKIKELNKRLQAMLELVNIEAKQIEARGLEKVMQAPDFWQDKLEAIKLSKQTADLNEQITAWQGLEREIGDLLEIAQADKVDQSVNLRKEIDQQVITAEKKLEKMELFFLMSGKFDQRSAIISIHAGAGGDDAQDWTEMLSRMYLRWAEKKNYPTEILDSTRGTTTGIKSITFRVTGVRVYGQLKGEYGVHRLVRLSPYDADKARHTSFALVEILPELEELDEVIIDEKDLKVDTFRASGAGGQHVNTTDSAVRITHLPTKFSVSCQNERSQASNKETALKILQAKLQHLKTEQRVDELKNLKGEHKQAAWGNQIRSYVLHPYKMVKDLRTEYEESDPDKVLDGDLDSFIESYLRFKVNK